MICLTNTSNHTTRRKAGNQPRMRKLSTRWSLNRTRRLEVLTTIAKSKLSLPSPCAVLLAVLCFCAACEASQAKRVKVAGAATDCMNGIYNYRENTEKPKLWEKKYGTNRSWSDHSGLRSWFENDAGCIIYFNTGAPAGSIFRDAWHMCTHSYDSIYFSAGPPSSSSSVWKVCSTNKDSGVTVIPVFEEEEEERRRLPEQALEHQSVINPPQTHIQILEKLLKEVNRLNRL